MNTIFIGIAGGTGSGKTTLTEHLVSRFGDDIAVVHHDNYYKRQDCSFEERCKQIAFRPAVEISYLAEEQQYTLLEAMSYNDATPSLAQAIKMKKFNQDGKLTDEVIQSIMEEEKPNQKEKPAFRDERITKLIPKTVPKGQETDFVVKALEFYTRHLQRNKAHER